MTKQTKSSVFIYILMGVMFGGFLFAPGGVLHQQEHGPTYGYTNN